MTEQQKQPSLPEADDFDMEQEILRQAEQVKNTKIEKDFSYFDHCKTMMMQIERDYRFAFIYTALICLLVSFTAMFKKRYQLFSIIGYGLGEPDNFVSIFCGGFAQVGAAFIILVIAYLAWAHLRRCNLFLLLFYLAMTILGVYKSDWVSAAIGLGGIIFYLRSVMSMVEDERISQLEGYPYFNERFELSKDDFERKPWKPDAPDRDKAYMEALTKKTLRGEKEDTAPPQKKKPEPQSLEAANHLILEEILSDKNVYTPRQEELPKLEDLTLGEETPASDAPAVTPAVSEQPKQTGSKNRKKGKNNGRQKK